jgi:hypothetical protein
MFKHFLLLMIVALMTAATIFAQETPTTATVRYNGIEFSYLPDAFGAVLPATEQGTPYQTDAPYFANIAPHTVFQFIRPNPVYPDVDWTGTLRVYRIADLEAYAEPSYLAVVQQLQTLNLNDLSSYVNVSPDYQNPALPFMPVLNATQVFRVHPSAFNSATVTGIEYYAYYSQAPEPILEAQVMYVYQGISSDGLYYVSFSMPVVTGVLGTEIAADFNWDGFVENYTPYLQDTFDALNAADPATFAPSHNDLNAFVESIAISQ